MCCSLSPLGLANPKQLKTSRIRRVYYSTAARITLEWINNLYNFKRVRLKLEICEIIFETNLTAQQLILYKSKSSLFSWLRCSGCNLSALLQGFTLDYCNIAAALLQPTGVVGFTSSCARVLHFCRSVFHFIQRYYTIIPIQSHHAFSASTLLGIPLLYEPLFNHSQVYSAIRRTH